MKIETGLAALKGSMVTAVSAECRGRVLLVDDRLESRELIADELADLGLQVVQAVDGVDGWERFSQFSFDLVITDLRMPRADGLFLLRRIRSPQSHKPQAPVIMLSAFGTLPIASEAGNAGATAFYSYDAAGIEELKSKVVELLAKRANELPAELLGESRPMREARALLTAHAELHTPVLLCGEVGSGRRIAARFIHDLAHDRAHDRAHNEAQNTVHGLASVVPIPLVAVPFVTVTPAAANPLDPQDASTIYLHDFDCFSEVDQRYWFDRILRLETLSPSARQRIVASTSDDLGPLIAAGCLDPIIARHLSSFRIDIPPLRRRIEDLSQILRSLLDRTEMRLGRRGFEIDVQALDALRKHNWYENISELGQVLESIVAAAKDRHITLAKVEAALARMEGPLRRIAAQEAKKERALLIRLWTQSLTYTGVASELGVTRNTAKNRMAKYNLVPGRGCLPGSIPRG